MGLFSKVGTELLGDAMEWPGAMAERWPELCGVRFRRGGFPLRIGGALLGQATVAAITVGKTVFLAPGTRLDPELLLHEFRHVQQFAEARMFPLRYIWQSLRRGYHANRYETDARMYAARRLVRITGSGPEKDG